MTICYINGEFPLKRLKAEGTTLFFMPGNKDYQPIVVQKGDDFTVWGIVTWVIKKT